MRAGKGGGVMLNRIGEFIIDGGWRALWQFAGMPVIATIVYIVGLVIASLIGRTVA